MNNYTKKICACGAIAMIIVISTPLCKMCLALQHPHLPEQGSFSYDYGNFRQISVSGINSTASIFTLWNGLNY